MANIERLFAQRSHVEAEVKKIYERISDGGTKSSSVRLKSYEIKLQCHYQEYERVYSELLSVLSAERFDDLEEDFSHFEDIHNNACALVKNLLLSVPTASGTGNYNRWTTSNSFTAPRWNTPPIRSQTPKPTTEQPVPIPAVNETPRTSLPNEIKVSTIITNPTQNEKPPHDEAAKNTILIRGFVEIRNPPTSEEDSRVGNEPTEFVYSKTEDSNPTTNPMPTGLSPVLMPFRSPPGFHLTPKRIPMPTGMLPVSQNTTGSPPVPQPLQSTTGSQSVSQPLRSTTGSLPVFHPLQCKTDSLLTSQQSRCVTGSCPVLQIPYETESFPTSKLPTPMTGLRPVQEQYPCADEPNPKRPDVAGIPPVLKPSLSTVEVSPVITPALMPIGASPVKKSTTTSFDVRSTTKPTTMPAGSPPVVKTISPSTGASPVGNPAPMAVGSPPMVKPTPTPMSTGTSSVGSSALRFTDASSVINYAYLSAGSHPVAKMISPSAGASPVGSSAPTAVGSRPMVKPTPMSAGNSPVGNFVQRSTGVSPVVEPIPMSTGNDSVGNYALRCTDTRSVFNYAKMPVGSSPMVMPILTSTGAHPIVDSIPMSVGAFPTAKPTLTHIEVNPRSQKSTGTSPVVKPTVISTGAKPFNDSAGLCPVAKPSPKPTDLHSVTQSNPTSSSTVAVNPPAPTMKINETNRTKKLTPPIAGTRPARNRVQSRTHQVQTPKTTEIRPATSCALMPFGIRPITKTSTRKQWIVVALKFDQPLLNPPPVITTGAFEQLHSGMRPRKPPDEPPKQTRPSEAIVERVSQTRPPNSPIRDDQALQFTIVPHFLAGEYVRANAKE